jgi:hypothetical protein
MDVKTDDATINRIPTFPAFPGQDSFDSHGVAPLHRHNPTARSPGISPTQRARLEFHRVGAPEGERNGNYRHGARTKEAFVSKPC